MRAGRAAVAGGAIALAFAAGMYLGQRPAPAPAPGAPAPVARTAAVHSAAPAPPRGPSLDELRAIVREEMQRRAGDDPAPAAPAPAARTEEVRAAVAKASAAVAEGVRRGVWGARERGELRAQLGQLGAAEIHEVLSPLFQAINAQQLQLDGPPI